MISRRPLRCAVACTVLLMTPAAATRLQAQQDDRKPCAPPALVAGLVDPADDLSALLRARQVDGLDAPTALTIRRPSLERAAACPDPDATASPFAILPVRVRAIYNTGYPLDVNTGAMWAGRGATMGLSAGGEFTLGPLSAGFYPLLSLSENRSFPIRPVAAHDYSRYTYDGHRMDWPQRFGDRPLHVLDPGQSYVRLEAFGVTAGVSTENMWLGPAQRMPLIMSSTAPGFPHAFVGTARPLDIGIGSLQVQAFWGRLSESEFFDNDPTNDRTLLAGLSAAYEPAFARGLFIGFNRMYLAEWAGGTIWSHLVDPYIEVRDNPLGDNQLFSLYARWVLPAAGFEAYAEWAREDHWGDWIDLLREPDHSQAYMLGFQKTGRWRDARLRWFGELAHLTSSTTLRGGRGVVTFYAHGELLQGYTHRGQLLGAWTGPGSDAQILGMEIGTDRRMSGISIERVRFDADAYYNQWARFYGQNGHDVSLGANLRHVEWRGDFSIHTGLGFARRHNRQFVRYDGEQPPQFGAENNVRLDLDVRWSPARWLLQ
jgi:hypothetical protein